MAQAEDRENGDERQTVGRDSGRRNTDISSARQGVTVARRTNGEEITRYDELKWLKIRTTERCGGQWTMK